MSNLEIILCIVSSVSISLLSVSLYFNIKHGVILIRLMDAIEESLDIMDKSYAIISKILETPLFYDSPQIREVLDEISRSRDAILITANKFATITESLTEEEPDDQEEN